MKPIFGSLGPQEAAISTPEALAEFGREMRVTGERPVQLTLEEWRIAAAPFIAAIREWAAREKDARDDRSTD